MSKQSANLPAPVPPTAGHGARAARIEVLRGQEADGSLDAKGMLELEVLITEVMTSDLSSQFVPELAAVKIVHSEQLFKNQATGELAKALHGVVLFSRLVRSFWLNEKDEDVKAGVEWILPYKGVDGPICLSSDAKVGALWRPETKSRGAQRCDICQFNVDNRGQHPQTAGKCKLGQRVLFLAYDEANGIWAQAPVILRLSSSSVRKLSAFYVAKASFGIMPYQLVVKLTLEKGQREEQVWSILNVEQMTAIQDFGIRKVLQDFVREYGATVDAPVSRRDAEAEVVE